jgi:hypothetical protein
VIRLCAKRAHELIGVDRPVSSQRFRTDGRTIFAESIDQAGEPRLLDLPKSQFAFTGVIGPRLYAGIEFLRWGTCRSGGGRSARRPRW